MATLTGDGGKTRKISNFINIRTPVGIMIKSNVPNCNRIMHVCTHTPGLKNPTRLSIDSASHPIVYVSSRYQVLHWVSITDSRGIAARAHATPKPDEIELKSTHWYHKLREERGRHQLFIRSQTKAFSREVDAVQFSSCMDVANWDALDSDASFRALSHHLLICVVMLSFHMLLGFFRRKLTL